MCSPDCVTAWLSKEQWEMCAKTALAQGVHNLDARTVPLALQLGAAVSVSPFLRYTL